MGHQHPSGRPKTIIYPNKIFINTRRSGFTMLELIMVIVIIGVLAALAIPQYVSFVEKARAAEAINYIGVIKNAQLAFIAANKDDYAASDWNDLGLVSTTPLWSYSLALGTAPNYFDTRATRSSGEYNGKYIELKYYIADRSSIWAGHSCRHSGWAK